MSILCQSYLGPISILGHFCLKSVSVPYLSRMPDVAVATSALPRSLFYGGFVNLRLGLIHNPIRQEDDLVL